MTDTDIAIRTAGTAAQGQSSNALIVQGYALSVQAQPMVDLSGFTNLVQYQTEINKALGTAQAHAKTYLNVVQPHAVLTINSIDSYFQTRNAVADALAPGTDKQTAIDILKAVHEESTGFHEQAMTVVRELQDARDGFSRSSADLRQSANNLAIAVDGDNGVLASLNGQLDDIDGKIAGSITGIVLSGLTIVGGAILIAVGAIGAPFTGGTSVPLIVGGLAVVAAGIGGEVGSSIALAGLLDAKESILSRRASLNRETTLAAGLSSGLGTLASSAANAATAAQGMVNAWTMLGNDLTSLINDLSKGQTEVDAMRRLFATAAQGVVTTVRGDIVIIKNQLAGAQTEVHPNASVTDIARERITQIEQTTAA